MIKELTITINPEDESNNSLIQKKIFSELKSQKVILKNQNEKGFEFVLQKKSVDARHGQIKIHLRYKVYIGESPKDSVFLRFFENLALMSFAFDHLLPELGFITLNPKSFLFLSLYVRFLLRFVHLETDFVILCKVFNGVINPLPERSLKLQSIISSVNFIAGNATEATIPLSPNIGKISFFMSIFPPYLSSISIVESIPDCKREEY